MSGVGSDPVVVLEVRPGDGGADAVAFASTLASAVVAFARRRGVAASVDDGARTVSVSVVSPPPAFAAALERFAGPHRVQRVPATESSGRRHSSTVTVAVLDGADGSTASDGVDPDDVVVEVFRASGPGGQHRNKVSSAVRVRHVPSGVVVSATESRSQHRNRVAAFAELSARLEALGSSELEAERNRGRREQIDTSSRARGWTWCEYRDEVTCHAAGVSMRYRDAVRGRFRL